MARYTTHEVDNRDANQMYEYLEARIDAMKRRISELETENQSMRDWIQYQTDSAAIEVTYACEAVATA
jgi:phage shock protein A